MTKYVDLCDTCINRIPSKPKRMPIVNAYGYVTGKSKLVMVKLCKKQLKGIRLLKAKCKNYSNTQFCPNCKTVNNWKRTFCKKCEFRLIESYG